MITVHLIVWRLERSEVLLVILRGQESIIGWNLECGAPWLEGQRVMKLCPNLVETVKGYAKHEKEALESVMKARYSCMSANTQEEKAQSENWLAGTLKTLFSVAENYPELKANANYISMMNSLQTIEAEIASSRKYYNGAVKVYNTKREVFPANIVARHYNFEKKVLFEIENVEERKAPKVEF